MTISILQQIVSQETTDKIVRQIISLMIKEGLWHKLKPILDTHEIKYKETE